uniref:Uncharacterized protein n=1 Tax=Anguilla anguilla TaxID=7936 RepID=A0A0E9WAP4_ANGAN
MYIYIYQFHCIYIKNDVCIYQTSLNISCLAPHIYIYSVYLQTSQKCRPWLHILPGLLHQVCFGSLDKEGKVIATILPKPSSEKITPY